MLSTESGKTETNHNPSRLLYRYQTQTRPSTWEIYIILTDFIDFGHSSQLSLEPRLPVYVVYYIKRRLKTFR